jgi:hypothetical protein
MAARLSFCTNMATRWRGWKGGGRVGEVAEGGGEGAAIDGSARGAGAGVAGCGKAAEAVAHLERAAPAMRRCLPLAGRIRRRAAWRMQPVWRSIRSG